MFDKWIGWLIEASLDEDKWLISVDSVYIRSRLWWSVYWRKKTRSDY
jgi:hypothetical protein